LGDKGTREWAGFECARVLLGGKDLERLGERLAKDTRRDR
jgi:hypothetical protein